MLSSIQKMLSSSHAMFQKRKVSVGHFLDAVGAMLDHEIANETLPSSVENLRLRSHRSGYLRNVEDKREYERLLELLLENLSEQTSLQFSREKRTFKVFRLVADTDD